MWAKSEFTRNATINALLKRIKKWFPRPAPPMRLDVSVLEDRILYSATPMPVDIVDAVDAGLSELDHSLQEALLDLQPAGDEPSATREALFIDASLDDLDVLLQEIARERDADVFLMERDVDGVAFVSSVLSSAGEEYGAIHIVSHGSAGSVQLGDTLLTTATIDNYRDQLSSWGMYLTDDADILIYGCDLANSQSGVTLLETLAELTQSDVAASDDATGHALLGGDWDLEYSIGVIDNELLLAADSTSGWLHRLANSITVTNTLDVANGDTSSFDALFLNDGGDGISLREAIIAANNTANGATPDEIRFNINGAGPHLIGLSASLPTITEAVLLDGWSEPDYAGTPVIIIDGNDISSDGLVLSSTADGSTIRGFVIRNFNGDGIQINSGSSGNTIAGNYIGSLTTSGTNAGASFANTNNGIRINGSSNTIGGTTTADRNVISGNALAGIRIDGTGAFGNQVLGNFVGTDASATSAIGNSQEGVKITNAAVLNFLGGTAVGSGNIISGNLNDAVAISGVGTDNNRALGNWIGVDATGNTALANGDDGIQIGSSASYNVVGDGTLAGRNVIAGNADDGVQLYDLGTNNKV
ncbi:MAG: DUF4347 domain-containing protein, partial [Planctomycetales bacterium]|nr:DUF4347 domain-containing protein [Planctomycetales bacterium]